MFCRQSATATTATATATTATSVAGSEPNAGTGVSQAETVATATIGEVEVNVEPIIVGIEMESPELLVGEGRNNRNTNQPPAFMQGLMQMLNNSSRGSAVGGNAGRSQASTTTANSNRSS